MILPQHATRRRIAAGRVPTWGKRARQLFWRVLASPVGSFLALAPILFVTEICSMWLAHRELSHSASSGLLVHFFMDLALVPPVLYLLFVLPTTRHLRRRVELESGLRDSQEALEQRVLERTAALRLSEKKYSSLVENSPTGICLIQDGRITFANTRLASKFGYAREELLGSSPLRLLHAADRHSFQALMNQLPAAGSAARECECRFLTRAGEVRFVALRHVTIPVANGVALLVNLQDVTDHLRLERELRELSSRLINIQEEERKRVARELHDGIGQTLTMVKLTIETALSGS